MREAFVVSGTGGLASTAEPEAVEGAVSQSWSARSCSRASPPDSVQNFSLPLTRRLICLTVDSRWLEVIGTPIRR